MSIEQALAENTAALSAQTTAIRELIERLSAGAATDKAPAAKSRTPKADAAAPVAAPVEAVTRFFYSAKHDSVWARKPEDPPVSMDGAVEITFEQFEAHSARLREKFAHLQQGASASPTQAPTAAPATAVASSPTTSAAAPAQVASYTAQQITEKLMAVNKAPAPTGGREAVMAILKGFGYAKVGEIKPEHYAAVAAKCDEITSFPA